MALCQRADGHQTTHHGPRLLLARVDRLAERLAAVRGSLDRVVSIAGQHSLLQGADATQGLTSRSHIVGRDCLNARLARLPDVRVRLPPLARLHIDALRAVLPHVPRSDCVLHLSWDKIFVRHKTAGAYLH